MVQINFGRKEVSCKIVYYGPGMSGKTTNLEVVHGKVPEQNRGDLTSISTDGDRTLFFDYMPLDLGSIAGMHTKFQLYTVPGQVYYNSTRKLVLQGVDGVVFVADSHPDKRRENLESFRNLEENLREYGKELKDLPHVIQLNKRDLPNAVPAAELAAEINKHKAPVFEAVAATGQGVFPTLKALAASVLESVNKSAQKTAHASPRPAAATSATAASAPKSPSPFTGNQPPGVGKPTAAPAARPAASATQTPAGKELPQLMSGAPRSAPAASTPAAPRPVRGPLPSPRSAPALRRQPVRRPAAKQKNQVAFGVVFGVLVLAAASGIVLFLVV